MILDSFRGFRAWAFLTHHAFRAVPCVFTIAYCLLSGHLGCGSLVQDTCLRRASGAQHNWVPSITAGRGWGWGACDVGRDNKGLAQRNPRTCKNVLSRAGSPLRTSKLTPCVERGASWPRTAEPMNLMSFTRCFQEAEFFEGGILTW